MPGSAETLSTALDLCEEAHATLLEENRQLRLQGHADEALLERKRALLPRLARTVQELRMLRDGTDALDDEGRALRAKAEKRMLQCFLLDRENEQLLLKHAVHPGTNRTASRPPPGRPVAEQGAPTVATNREQRPGHALHRTYGQRAPRPTVGG